MKLTTADLKTLAQLATSIAEVKESEEGKALVAAFPQITSLVAEILRPIMEGCGDYFTERTLKKLEAYQNAGLSLEQAYTLLVLERKNVAEIVAKVCKSSVSA